MPLLSVILPVYNTEQYIAEAVQSILDQTFTDFELLVINDASTDNTLKILESFTDPRLKIINNPTNLKVVKSLNKGLDMAQGTFIARMDADDIACPQRFEKQVAYLLSHPNFDVCGSWVKMIGLDNYILTLPENHDDIKAELLFKNILVHPSVILRKSSFDNIRYDEDFVNAEDYALWVDVLDKERFAITPEILLKYRVHNANVSIQSGKNSSILREMNYLVYKKLLQRIGVTYDEHDLLIHFSLGFRSLDFSNIVTVEDCLSWMKKIVAANNKSRYFNKASLRNLILNNIIFLAKSRRSKMRNRISVITYLIRFFSINEYLAFVRYKIRRRSLTKKRLRLYNEIDIEYR